jgi:hypothetical protein
VIDPAPQVGSPEQQGWDVPESTAKAARAVDTGRLYHSAGAEGPATSDAIAAIPAAVATAAVAAHVTASPPAVNDVAGPHRVEAADGQYRPEQTPMAAPPTRVAAVRDELPENVEPSVTTTSHRVGPAATAPRAARRGLTYLGALIVIGVPTFLIGLAESVFGGGVGWLTGVVLLLTTSYAAVAIRSTDSSAPIVIPPLAFLVTVAIAGQFSLETGKTLAVREGYMIFSTLAVNAFWIIGASIVGTIIVLVRRRFRS